MPKGRNRPRTWLPSARFTLTNWSRAPRSVLILWLSIDFTWTGENQPVRSISAKAKASMLDSISAEMASTPPKPGRATLAAHVDHLRYCLELANRALRGDQEAYTTADWTQSWTIRSVDEARWNEIKAGLRRAYEAVREVLAADDTWLDDDVTLTGMLGHLAHTGYHLGAIRQSPWMPGG